MERLDLIKEIFAINLLLTRKWEVIYNRNTDDELTLKQLMMLIVIKSAFNYDPTIKEVGMVLSTSHQNVKAIALQLEKKNFITLYKDSNDKRVTRVKVSEEREAYWQNRNDKDQEILEDLFVTIDEEQLRLYLKTLRKLDSISDTMLK